MIYNKNSHSIQITPSSQWHLLLISSPRRSVKYRTHVAGVTLSLWSLVMHRVSCCMLIISLRAGCCRSCCLSYQSMCLNLYFWMSSVTDLLVNYGISLGAPARHICWCRLQLIRTKRGLFSLFEDKTLTISFAPRRQIGRYCGLVGPSTVARWLAPSGLGFLT